MNFINAVKIKITSGDGGKGCESFHRRTDKKTVPNGGNGGDGGDVIFEADRNEYSLKYYSYKNHFEALKGYGGSSNQMTGRKGQDITLKVPCGTSIYNLSNNFLIRDLEHDGDRVVVLKGGQGGSGNDHGKKASEGKPGETLEVLLDYTLVADISIIGFPNSGKSTLLRAMTGSKVKSEAYPFSTKTPQLGTFESEKYERITCCELPALERGSFEGKGLGNDFLKNLKRTKLIFLILDPVSAFADSLGSQKEILQKEIAHFNKSFLDMPCFYVINKSDLEIEGNKPKLKLFGPYTFVISAENNEGIDKLKKEAGRYLRENIGKS